MRSVGILCTRKPPSEAAIAARKKMWLSEEKMIILLDDEDLEEILCLKAADDNPAQVIESQIDEFFMNLSEAIG
jgi:hypothetical protein